MHINHGQGILDPVRYRLLLMMDVHKIFDEFGKTFLYDTRTYVLHQSQLESKYFC